MGEPVPFGTGSTPSTLSPHANLAGQSHGDICTHSSLPMPNLMEVWEHPALALPHAGTLPPLGCRAAMVLSCSELVSYKELVTGGVAAHRGSGRGACQPALHAGPGRLPSKLGSRKLWFCIQAVLLPKPAARCEQRGPSRHLPGRPRKGSRGGPGFWITFAKDGLAKQTCNEPNRLSSLGGQILHKHRPG